VARVKVRVRTTADEETFILKTLCENSTGRNVWIPKDNVDKDLAEMFEAVLNGDMDPNDCEVTVNQAKYLYSLREIHGDDPDQDYTYSVFETKADANCHGCGAHLPKDYSYPKRNGYWMCHECIELTPAEIQANYQAWKRHNGVR
jgi:hypothetical protein